MFGSFKPPYQRATVILVVLAAVSAAGAVLVGIEENPPGIALAMLAGAILVTAFVHHWRSPKRFLTLCAISFGLIVILAGSLIAIDISLTGGHVPESVAPSVESGGNALALMVAFLAVPSLFVGLAGALVVWLAGRR
jgi:putative exporter of polyketide antibiotics